MTTAIALEDVVKRFGTTVALDHLTFEVEVGEVHGYLGPNGAGKSVTLRTLLGLLRQDSGTVRLLGGDPWLDAVELHRRIAFVPGDVSLWPNLTGGEIIDYFAHLRGDVDPDRRARLVDRFELDTRKKANTYSKGNRQKVALVTALAARAELLLLDEPTSGLDPLMEQAFQTTINEIAAEGRTVLLSSHILAEVESLCDRVTIIRNGTVVQHGTLEDLRATSLTTITVATERALDPLEPLRGVRSIHERDGAFELQVDTKELDGVMRHLASLGIRSLVSRLPTLEELFLSDYSADGEGREAARS